jgi:hypothetical protein
MHCVECESPYIVKKGITNSYGVARQRYKCRECNTHFSVAVEDVIEAYDDDIVLEKSYERDIDWLQENVYSKKRIVIAAAQNNTAINEDFYSALKTYCDAMNASMIVIPIKHKTINSENDESANFYDERLEDVLVENTIEFPFHNIRIYAGLKIQATAENPLSGLDPLSKGYSIIVGHAQVQLKTLPNIDNRISDILTTTGAITEKNYSKTKLGEKARFNHSLSAIVLELDQTHYHLRHLNFCPTTKSFWDIDKEFLSTKEIRQGNVKALVTGDEHVIWRDSLVEQWTYKNDQSIVNVLRPEKIVRHDSLDSYSISHHHRKNVFTQFAKWKSGLNSIEREIRETVNYINETTPEFSESIIVQSNHNEHLLRWLNEIDIKTEPWNAKLYHYLMYQMLEATEMGQSGATYPDPLELITRGWLKENVRFISRNGEKILDIEIGSHGDIGVNGARGSAKSFARIPDKMIVGHSHSPSIEKGCYVVGTSSKLSLEYNKGASTWHHAHVVIHPNGKRQMLFITSDGWRLTE